MRRLAAAVAFVGALAACDDDSSLPAVTSPPSGTTSAAPTTTATATSPATTTEPESSTTAPDVSWSPPTDTGGWPPGVVGTFRFSVTTDEGTFGTTGEIEWSQSADAPVATLATDAPDGRPVSVRLEAIDDGTIAMQVDAGPGVRRIATWFAAEPDEQFFGLGQRATAVDHRGRTVVNHVFDGPWPTDQAEVVKNFVPQPGFSRRRDATYFPLPWVLSSEGYGVLVDNDETSRFRFATAEAPDMWSVEVDASRLDLRVFAGRAPADALRRMTAAIGRQPPAAAPFYFGPWWQASDDEAAELAAIREAGVPLSLAQTYTHYLPCGDHQGQRAGERARTRRMHDAGLAVTTYINPMVCVGYDAVYRPGVAAAAFTRRPDGEPYTYHYSTATEFDVAQFDFSSQPGRDLFHRVLDLTVKAGYDGWMEDFGEYTPTDAVSADGTPGTVMHNRYVEQYHAAAHDFAESAPRPLARFNRSGWTEAIHESQIVWGGDPTTDWGFDGLQSAVRSGVGMGLSGVSLWGSDIGGFFTWPGDELTPELLRRWIQFGAFSGVMRLQSGGISITDAPRATVLDPEVLPVWKRYSQLRTRLYPYIAGAEETYDATGLPLMRHPVLAYPGSAAAAAGDDQYLFGADLFVAPILEPGATEREVALPPGRWVDLWRSATMDGDGEILLGAAEVRAGDVAVTVDAPADEIPLHVRIGSIVPLLPEDVDTLTAYGDAPGLVHLGDRDDVRDLLAFPGVDWTGPLGPGETMRSDVDEHDRWTMEIDGAVARTYRVQASLAGFGSGWEPCSAVLDGEDIPFTFDAETAVLVLTASTSGPDAVLVVSPCG